MRRQYLLLRLSFSLGVLFCAFLTMTEKAFSEIPRGVFCMLGVGGGVGKVVTGEGPIVEG